MGKLTDSWLYEACTTSSQNPGLWQNPRTFINPALRPRVPRVLLETSSISLALPRYAWTIWVRYFDHGQETTYLIFLLPLVSLLLYTLDLSFKVFCFHVDLSQPIEKVNISSLDKAIRHTSRQFPSHSSRQHRVLPPTIESFEWEHRHLFCLHRSPRC